jgi:undecaprenyldiphospho-muramoylpentapeptide beta-N-acetylglucosaminyltransferase
VLPGIAIAKALERRGHDAASIHFVGSGRGLEATLVPDAGYSVTLLPGRGIQRRVTLENLAAVAGLIAAVARAIALVRRLRPSIVVSLGGYASFPCAVAAVLWRVPVLVAEQNAVPGRANALVARFARASAVSFPGTPLPRAEVTGNPLRPEIVAVAARRDRAAARSALRLPADGVVVAVFGGSLGARRINDAALGARAAWRERDALFVYHVVGTRDWDAARRQLAGEGAAGGRYRAVRYEDRMDLLLAAADIAVCRAGATTVAELAAVGVPSILIPLPGAPGDHQTANARALVDAGAAVLVPDAELDSTRLVAEVDALVRDPARRRAMASAASATGRPGAAEAVAELAERHALDG